jgi:tetratricopeptide (TPR) repeat protein
MVDLGLISYCERQSRDGSPKSRRLAEASVSILKLSTQLPSIGETSIESVIMELYPGYLDQKNIQAMSRSFLTSTTVDKINLSKLKERQTKLLKITVSMGLVLLQIGKHTPALVAAQQYLVLAADIYGTNSLELIPAYLLIAEVSIQLNKLREAEQQLQKANWVVMRNENDPTINNVKQRLSRLLGLLQAAKGNKDESIRLFSEQIFFASMMNGTESVGASSGYYNLGNIIEAPKVKNSLYLKCKEVQRQGYY